MRDREYDRFGPWALEISGEDPLPPLFVPHVTRTETPLLGVKVPRRIERRNARPGMHLYDYVVTLYAEDLVVLRREGDEVVRSEHRYDDIHALVYSEELLDGRLELCLPGGRHVLRFNTVSGPLMRRMLGMLRSRCTAPARATVAELPALGERGELSFLFEGILRRMSVEAPRFRIVAAQAETRVGQRDTNLLRRVFLGIIARRLMESVHLCDDTELLIIDRGRRFRYRGQAVYGCREHYIPLRRFTGVRLTPHPRDPTLSVLDLRTATDTFAFAFMSDNRSLDGLRRWQLQLEADAPIMA